MGVIGDLFRQSVRPAPVSPISPTGTWCTASIPGHCGGGSFPMPRPVSPPTMPKTPSIPVDWKWPKLDDATLKRELVRSAELKAITRPGYHLIAPNPDGSWRMIPKDVIPPGSYRPLPQRPGGYNQPVRLPGGSVFDRLDRDGARPRNNSSDTAFWSRRSLRKAQVGGSLVKNGIAAAQAQRVDRFLGRI